MVQGDFNAYTNTKPDFVTYDSSINIPINDDHYIEDHYMPRKIIRILLLNSLLMGNIEKSFILSDQD